MKYSLGVDVGGTKIAAALIDEHGKAFYPSQVKSVTTDKETMFHKLIECIETVFLKSGFDPAEITGMGIGVPGKVDRSNGIAVYQNNLPWSNFPLVSRLKQYFAIENIVIDNDVYMAAYAEWKMSDVKETDTFVFFTISTGVSCSIIHNGAFLRGMGFAGEIGLFPVQNKSSLNGMKSLEESVSGPAIQQVAAKKLGTNLITTEGFFKVYQQGNARAVAALGEIIESLTHGVYGIISLLDPHKIVFGGRGDEQQHVPIGITQKRNCSIISYLNKKNHFQTLI
ncbi:ROK family protein [Virgibacillus halophilus]|uniref:ROK family protein n=1 Tax=Tigheibacillus halophilus TaxID=361280 RepID=A0ABU5C5Q6_9BACI|nr:ROK family protein [Virgibacillus halophilus]